MRFAAIDIGSNAVRLLLCNVYETDDGVYYKKAELVRMPVRLGEDAFRYGKITHDKMLLLAKSLKAFRLLIDVFGAIKYHACATSAMREAENSAEVIDFVREYSGIDIELINGKREAQIIYSNHVAEHLEPGNSYLYIDVGGGSTELTVFADSRIVSSQSFNIGTIRLLHNQVPKDAWNNFKERVREHTINHQGLIAIGSGGNINKLVKMGDRKESRPLTYLRLRELYERLRDMPYEQRITELGLNPDRADVIIPAAKIFLTIMKIASIEKVIVPQVGLADGIIHLLYEEYRLSPELNLK